MNTQTEIPDAVLTKAVHEAGHAVAAFVLKLPLLGVSIEHGCAIETPETPPENQADLANNIAVFAFAGPAAEQLFTGTAPKETAAIDEALAQGVLADHPSQPVQTARDQARDTITQRWTVVLALANELIARGGIMAGAGTERFLQRRFKDI